MCEVIAAELSESCGSAFSVPLTQTRNAKIRQRFTAPSRNKICELSRGRTAARAFGPLHQSESTSERRADLSAGRGGKIECRSGNGRARLIGIRCDDAIAIRVQNVRE